MMIKVTNKIAVIALIFMPFFAYAGTASNCSLGESCTLSSYDTSLVIPVTKKQGTSYNCAITANEGVLVSSIESDGGFQFTKTESEMINSELDFNATPSSTTVPITGVFDKTGKGAIKITLVQRAKNVPAEPGLGRPYEVQRTTFKGKETVRCTANK